MRILHVINSLNTGGAEKLIIDSVPIYQQKGCVVDVLLLKNVPSPFREKLEKNSTGNVLAISKYSVYNPLLIFKIIPYLKKYDVLHTHLFPSLYWVVLAKWISFSKTKIVYTEHNTHNRRRDDFLLKHIDKFIYSRIDFIGCISQDTHINLQTHLNRKDKIAIINNGINLSRFKNISLDMKRKYYSQDDILLVQVSSFREQKDQKTLIHALLLLPESIKLILVGDGMLKDEHINFVKSLNLESRVNFLGNRYDIPEILSQSDIVVLSSHYEGFGLAIVEGMAVGKPVIASDVPGLREIVKEYGLLFEKGNSKELAEKIMSLVNDQEYYNDVAAKCTERAKDFDINGMVEKYIEVYKRVVKHV